MMTCFELLDVGSSSSITSDTLKLFIDFVLNSHESRPVPVNRLPLGVELAKER